MSIQGYSSVGRAAVSKTACREFKSYYPCHAKALKPLGFKAFLILIEDMAHGLFSRIFVFKTVLISYAFASVFKNSVRYIIILASFSPDNFADFDYRKQFCGNIFHSRRLFFAQYTICLFFVYCVSKFDTPRN